MKFLFLQFLEKSLQSFSIFLEVKFDKNWLHFGALPPQNRALGPPVGLLGSSPEIISPNLFVEMERKLIEFGQVHEFSVQPSSMGRSSSFDEFFETF